MALTEAGKTGSCIISLANGNQSKDNVTLLSGQDLAANTVLGKITASGKYAAVDPGSPDGRATAAAILLEATDASGGDKTVAIIARDAEVIADELIWPTTSPAVDTDAGIVDLATHGILVRS